VNEREAYKLKIQKMARDLEAVFRGNNIEEIFSALATIFANVKEELIPRDTIIHGLQAVLDSIIDLNESEKETNTTYSQLN
jgi:CII-binding regulator of phage lambda lysogenization HflD